jgi:uncharacterized protein
MEKLTLVLGASSNPDRFSYKAITNLLRRNIPVLAVGRKDADLGTVKIMKGMPAYKGNVHTVTLYLNAVNQKLYYDYIFSLNPKRIIFNPGTANKELADASKKKGIEVVEDCMLVMLNKGKF